MQTFENFPFSLQGQLFRHEQHHVFFLPVPLPQFLDQRGKQPMRPGRQNANLLRHRQTSFQKSKALAFRRSS